MRWLCDDPPCPFRDRCERSATAAAVLLGPVGTRRTLVPDADSGTPSPIDPREPSQIASRASMQDVRRIALHALERDDLPDGGAATVAATVRTLRTRLPGVSLELHTGDFGGELRRVRDVLRTLPDLFHHALPTSPRLFPKVVPGGDYVQSLETLRVAKEEFERIRLRSTVVVGLGETRDELVASLADLKSVRVDEVLLAHAAPAPGRTAPSADLLARIATVAQKLHFARFEIVAHPRACVADSAPGPAPPTAPKAKRPARRPASAPPRKRRR